MDMETILKRRSFVKAVAAAAASALLPIGTGVTQIGCGPAHRLVEELGLCCDKDYKGPHPKPGAPLIVTASNEFDQNRLIEKINTDYKVYEFDPDLFGFVNNVFGQVHGVPVPSHLTYEFGNTMGLSVIGRYVAGHIILAPGLSMKICISTLMHEIGHDYDRVTLSETPAEFESIRGTLESLVLHPILHKETDYALLKYSNEKDINWGDYDDLSQYGSAVRLCYLSIIKNRGDLQAAQFDLNGFFLNQTDAHIFQLDNHSRINHYLMEELKDMSMASWLGVKEQQIAQEDRPALIKAMRLRQTPHEQDLRLPPGIVVPVNYADYLSRSVE